MTQRNCIVTGAGSGIGQAIAWALDQAGWNVALVGRTEAKLFETQERAPGPKNVGMFPCDIGKPGAAAKLVPSVEATMGPVALLVNSAGVNAKLRRMCELTPEEWDRQLNINLTGAFLAMQAVLPGMRQRRDGLIVNISSVAAPRPSMLAGAAYSASKAGLSALSSVVAQEEAAHSIRCTAILPGEVDTPILAVRPEPVSAERRASILRPEDVAAAAMFVVNLPARAHVPELVIKPTVHQWQ